MRIFEWRLLELARLKEVMKRVNALKGGSLPLVSGENAKKY